MASTTPNTIQISLPEDQVELLAALKDVQERLLATHNNSVWLTTEEAAQRLKVSKKTVDEWRKAGWLRYVQDGTKLYWYRSDYLDQDVEAKLGVKAFLAPLTRR